ncbi:MAG: methyltransferase domain-containing protein [Planctomycetes bacterium]|jgi:phospholipid N-methyltransferase|nr:methyltransferase domain-containing protein [Planctomycetota bacterium]
MSGAPIPSAAGASAASGSGSWFLRKFLRDPKEVASVWPSSRFLARAMVAGIDMAPGESIVELGPGTGPFTDAIVPKLASVPGASYLGIDRDPEFIAHLRRRHPGLEFVQADAFALPELLAARPQLRVRAVLSGLPLVALPKPQVTALSEFVHGLLPTGGAFRTFSYLHTVVNPASWWLRGLLRERFARFVVNGPVWRNVPPALVFAAQR